MPMQSVIIQPILGLKTNVPNNDTSLFNGNATYCVDMRNVDFNRIRSSANKTTGLTQFTVSQNTQKTRCLGLFELVGSAATDHIVFDNGKFYYVAADRSQTNVDAAAPVTFGQSNDALISMIQYSDYIIFTDRSRTLTPYKWKNGDVNLTKLTLAGTEYKFSYIEAYQRRIIGAYSDQTNGDIEIRWTNALPAWAGLSFPTANQLYKPGNDSITGIKTFGSNACFLYGSNSIDSIDYYANYTTPFAIRNLVSNQGSTGHHSIVDIGSAHLLFNRFYGFCAYAGGTDFPAGGKPISEPIDNWIGTINPLYYHLICGTFIPQRNEVCWAVPLDGASTNNSMLFYDLRTGSWRRKDIAASYVDFWVVDTSIAWSDLPAIGYTYWSDFGLMTWSDLISSKPYLVSGNTGGHVYIDSGESNLGAAWDAYRTEPMLPLPIQGNARSLLLEIWFSLASIGNYSLNVWYRGGDTVGECSTSPWVVLTEVSCNSPSNAVCYLSQNNRYHQIRWGTDAASEPFSVNAIEFKFVPQGVY
jgi:hypothetical protein